jgi:hypothetical protein
LSFILIHAITVIGLAINSLVTNRKLSIHKIPGLPLLFLSQCYLCMHSSRNNCFLSFTSETVFSLSVAFQ